MKTNETIVKTPEGEIHLIEIINANGAKVTLSSLGAGINIIEVPDREGKMADVLLGYADAADYFRDGPCAGKTPGRYANRIGAGLFNLDGRQYQLAVNCGSNHLHGGPEGFQNRLWDSAIDAAAGKVTFSRLSPDGEEGYPGNLTVKVTYGWSDDDTLTIDYEAVTDAPTIINLTNHAYFNLRGHNSGSALDHTLWLNCSRCLVTDDSLRPTGDLADVAGTPMDFTTPKPLGRDINADFEPLRHGKGYDHCFAVDGYEPGKVSEVAQLTEASTGRRVRVYSDQPGAQLYTGNWLTGSPQGKEGMTYNDYDFAAIECQGFPDAPNHESFPSQTLRPGETFARRIIYKFDAI